MEHRRIKELRGHLDLSQERFARLVGVSLQTVRRWESGLTKPLPIISLKLEELQREVAAPRHASGDVPMKETREEGEARVDLGLGGLFRGIGSLVDLVSRMAEEGEEGATRTDEMKAFGGKLKGVYGVSVRTGLEGRPVIEQFGNLLETESGPVVSETREPLVDVFDEGDYLRVIVELPGVEERDIQLKAVGDILEIAAHTRDRKYQKEVLLTSAVDLERLASSYRNGVLEIRLPKQ